MNLSSREEDCGMKSYLWLKFADKISIILSKIWHILIIFKNFIVFFFRYIVYTTSLKKAKFRDYIALGLHFEGNFLSVTFRKPLSKNCMSHTFSSVRARQQKDKKKISKRESVTFEETLKKKALDECMQTNKQPNVIYHLLLSQKKVNTNNLCRHLFFLGFKPLLLIKSHTMIILSVKGSRFPCYHVNITFIVVNPEFIFIQIIYYLQQRDELA